MAAAPEVVRLSELVRFEPRQCLAYTTAQHTRFTLYGGARGGGKSFFLRWLAIVLLAQWAAAGHVGVRVGVFCETFPALKDRQLSRARRGRVEERYPEWLGTWNVADSEFRLRPEYGGGTVCFRNLDDTGKYLSSEFAAVLVDELTRSSVHVIMQLLGSLRWPGIEHTPFVATTNPGSKGHAWVKDVFVDGAFELEETKNLREAFGADAFAFVRALVTDNPHNAASYAAMLAGLPDRLRRAYLHGDWDSFDGQAFTEWSRDVHVVPNDLHHLRDAQWLAGLDWGYRKGAYVLCAVLPDRIEVVADLPFSQLYAKPAAKAIMHVTRHLPRPAMILYDDQMNQQTGAERLIDAFAAGLHEQLRDGAPALVPGAKGPGSRASKYALLHELLAWGPRAPDGTVPPWCAPQLVVQQRARYCVRSLPALQVDPDRPDEDVDTDGDDHAYDALMNVAVHVGPRSRLRALPASSVDRHPGVDPQKKRRRRAARPQAPDAHQGRDGLRVPRDAREFHEVTE
ncbi:MAG: hypothetical protein IT355_12085 [Gemmatimonadaceae bacterium]|nr:hypothetical protein [Gemmatimonadaceae bacterium]